jgi:hypothetical protein
MQPYAITIPENRTVNYLFNESSALPVNAGSYQVVATVSDLNYEGNTTATFIIQPVKAAVKADDKVINQFDPLPQFTASFSGFVNGENATVVTLLTFSLSPAYTGSAGEYEIIPSASALNYWFNPVSGTLYVNPYGTGTRNIKTSLVCVQSIPMDADGYTYIANFKYENPNSTAVYVPIGPDNLLSGMAKFENSQQPVVFLPGTGTWQVRFNGNKITWSVTTYNGSHKTSTASYASSSSNKCGKSLEITTSDQTLSSIGPDEPEVYPNPTTDKVYITFRETVVLEKDIFVSDLSGRMVQAKVEKTTGTSIKVDLSDLESGVYLIRLKLADELKVLRIIKQ